MAQIHELNLKIKNECRSERFEFNLDLVVVSGFIQVQNTNVSVVWGDRGPVLQSVVTPDSCGCTQSTFTVSPTVLPTVHYSPQSAFLSVNVNWIMQFSFFSQFAFLFNLWVHFAVYCSFCAVAYKKKRNTFFFIYVKEQIVFNCVKARVECWITQLAEKFVSSLAKVICKVCFIFKDLF